MKKIIGTFALVMILLSFSAGSAQARISSVKGYYRSSGAYVAPHYKTTSNRTKIDNWSSKGNSNPFSGKKGYVNPYSW